MAIKRLLVSDRFEYGTYQTNACLEGSITRV